MAKSYYALNQIQHGEGDTVKVFEPGQQVTGLDKEQMVALWNAGVLTEHDPAEAPADHRDDKIAALEAELAELRASQSAAAVPQGEGPEGSAQLQVAPATPAETPTATVEPKKAATPPADQK